MKVPKGCLKGAWILKDGKFKVEHTLCARGFIYYLNYFWKAWQIHNRDPLLPHPKPSHTHPTYAVPDAISHDLLCRLILDDNFDDIISQSHKNGATNSICLIRSSVTVSGCTFQSRECKRCPLNCYSCALWYLGMTNSNRGQTTTHEIKLTRVTLCYEINRNLISCKMFSCKTRFSQFWK